VSHNRQPSSCLGVVHVPKTGGSALRSALAELPGCYVGPRYFDEHQFGSTTWIDGIPAQQRNAIATHSDLAEIAKGHRLVLGHFTANSLLLAGCASIAMQVREPRARVLSLYRFWQSQPEHVRSDWGPWGTEVVSRADLPLREFLTAPGVWPAVDNAMAYQALDYRTSRWQVFGRDTTIARRCIEYIERPSIFDWSARSESFLERVCEAIGAAVVPSLRRENVTEVVGDEEKIDSSTFRLLTRLTCVDRLFLDQLSEHGALPRRSSADLDFEFEVAATELGFRLP